MARRVCDGAAGQQGVTQTGVSRAGSLESGDRRRARALRSARRVCAADGRQMPGLRGGGEVCAVESHTKQRRRRGS